MKSSDSEAVTAYRDQFGLNCSKGRKADIDATVADLELWRKVLASWGYQNGDKWIKFNPLNIGHMLSEYERLERKAAGYVLEWEEIKRVNEARRIAQATQIAAELERGLELAAWRESTAAGTTDASMSTTGAAGSPEIAETPEQKQARETREARDRERLARGIEIKPWIEERSALGEKGRLAFSENSKMRNRR